jgi:hypothetical protein
MQPDALSERRSLLVYCFGRLGVTINSGKGVGAKTIMVIMCNIKNNPEELY